MAEAFLRKRKDKARVPSAARPAPAPAAAPIPTPRAPAPQAAHVHEIKLFSSFGGDDRYNIIRLNSSHPVDIAKIPGPLLLNRKDLEYEQQAKTLAYDETGAVIGKYVYDNDNKPVLDAEGKHVIEVKEQADRSLIGGPDRSRKGKKGVKEVYHQDREIMRLRREETVPWVLESASVSREAAQRGEGGKLPVHWTGQYQEPSALPTVLLLNNGNEHGFRVVPLGRTYKFEPDRPFKPIDVDEANRMVRQFRMS
jgi:transcription initiation factor TFIIF subunit alpha